MLFNSPAFIFWFLPITLGGFFVLGRHSPLAAAAWLALASLFFYGWWDPLYVGLLAASMVFNYVLCVRIVRGVQRGRGARGLLTFAIVSNLALLAYYKYANLFVDNLNAVAGTGISLDAIILPLGISFFTFTQIAFLVETFKGKVTEYRFVHYCLFVPYFPHLIAGPILHHAEMMRQFARRETYRMQAENIAVRLTIFFIGLYKKVILADGIAQYVAPFFDAVRGGARLAPGLEQEFRQSTRWNACLERKKMALDGWARQHEVTVIDAGASERYGCLSREFSNEHHAYPECNARVLRRFFADMKGGACAQEIFGRRVRDIA